jgi:hypothetical protein
MSFSFSEIIFPPEPSDWIAFELEFSIRTLPLLSKTIYALLLKTILFWPMQNPDEIVS